MLNKLCLAVFVFSCCFGSVSAQTDFFWSLNDLNTGAVNDDLVENFEPGERGSLYLYYTTDGPADSDLRTGAFLDISTSKPGIIRFIGAETFNFDISFNGTPFNGRWTSESGLGGGFGETGNVTDNFIDELGAFTVPAFNDGIVEDNDGSDIFIDEGYDAAADAFLFGRVDFVVVGSGSISVITSSGAGQIVDFPPCFGSALDVTFGQVTINVGGKFVLGDVNMDGELNLLDVQPFVNLLSNGRFQLEADINMDGKVDLLDVQGFVDLLSGGGGESSGGGEDDGGGGDGGKGTSEGPCLTGDINLDGVINLLDVQPFVALVLAGGYQCEADINQDGAVDLLDLPCFFELLSG